MASPADPREPVVRDRRNRYNLEELLAVVAHEFLQRGYDATSMEDLSRATGRTKSSIYHHVSGKEDVGHLPFLQAFCVEDTPTLDLDMENPFFSDKRAKMLFTELFAEVEAEYERIARFAVQSTVEQLERKARIPKLKESPLGEYPTLQAMIGGLGEYHLQFHIDQMREILQLLEGSQTED